MCVPFSVYLFINVRIVSYIWSRTKFQDSRQNHYKAPVPKAVWHYDRESCGDSGREFRKHAHPYVYYY